MHQALQRSGLIFVGQAFQPAIIWYLGQAGWKACPTKHLLPESLTVYKFHFFVLDQNTLYAILNG